MSVYITGLGAALPARTVTNAELAPLLKVAPEWIEANSGIRERRWVQAHESTSMLAAAAVREALPGEPMEGVRSAFEGALDDLRDGA